MTRALDPKPSQAGLSEASCATLRTCTMLLKAALLGGGHAAPEPEPEPQPAPEAEPEPEPEPGVEAGVEGVAKGLAKGSAKGTTAGVAAGVAAGAALVRLTTSGEESRLWCCARRMAAWMCMHMVRCVLSRAHAHAHAHMHKHKHMHMHMHMHMCMCMHMYMHTWRVAPGRCTGCQRRSASRAPAVRLCSAQRAAARSPRCSPG